MRRCLSFVSVAVFSALQFCAAVEKRPLPTVQLTLVRYDLPLPFGDGTAPTRVAAHREQGPHAVDWPDFTLNGRPLWNEQSVATAQLKARPDTLQMPFRAADDAVIEPGNHWLRLITTVRGQPAVYSADPTSRTAPLDGSRPGAFYELWGFPVVVQGSGGPVVKNVELRYAGRVVYRKPGPWRSLTLLLPAGEPGRRYALTVDGRGPVQFEVGLLPVKPGRPRERLIPLQVVLPGEGPRLTLQHAVRPPAFAHAREWEQDLAGLSQAPPSPLPVTRRKGLARTLGAEVPVSPLTIYAVALPRGQSSGFFRQDESPDEYASALARAGFDTSFEAVGELPPSRDRHSLETRAAAFARQGLQMGLQFDQAASRASLQHPCLALFAHTLPEWHAPLYRSLSIAAQRFVRWPNFAGFQLGSTPAGYRESQAADSIERSWAEAILDPGRRESAAPAHSADLPATRVELLRKVQRYEVCLRQYGYFATAVREVSPRLVVTTGAFGGGRADIGLSAPSTQAMFAGLNVQQAFASPARAARRPLVTVALIDRLRSTRPHLKTWALLDHHSRGSSGDDWQRALALVLTRGVQGLGTNQIARGDQGEDGAAFAPVQAEMNRFARQFGGVFAQLTPAAAIGVLFSHHQALRQPPRRVGASAGAPPPVAHEDAVTEALALCHSAGWPARVVTDHELRRGPLPESMQALLLVGLGRFDDSWTWAEGLEPALQRFVDAGGRILCDEESSCPAPSRATGVRLSVEPPAEPHALAAQNRARLRVAMEGARLPMVASSEADVWAIPASAADTDYVTVLNPPGGETGNSGREVQAVPHRLRWSTDRPIYDVRLGRQVSREEAEQSDLRGEVFRWYALPPAEIVAPTLTVVENPRGFPEARVTMKNGARLDGLPIALEVRGTQDQVQLYSASGSVVRLPLDRRFDRGEFTVTARELITGLSTQVTITLLPPPEQPTIAGAVDFRDPVAIARFVQRRAVPLTIALTAEQQRDATVGLQAKALADFFRAQGRQKVSVGFAGPGGVVVGLQPAASANRYPQWQTSETDLVLFGSPRDHVLLRDQARAEILPVLPTPAPGRATIVYTRSPFRGECDVLNVLTSDVAGITAAVQALRNSSPTAGR